MNAGWAVVLVSMVLTAGPSHDPIDIIAGVGNDHADVVGKRHFERPSTPVQRASAPKALTSYQPVCVSEGEEVLSSGRCGNANLMCAQEEGSVPVWVLTAPARPAPTADDWVNTGRVDCQGGGDDGGAAPVVLSAAQFRRLPIPAARIRAQPDPADRPTLVGVQTNLLTRRKVEELTTTVLGQAVRVRATPTSYHWLYGDGEQRTTAQPGMAYPSAMPTAHIFRRAGSFVVTLATTFSGEYSVGGGPWTSVDGTAEVESPAVTVQAVEARTHLVS